MLLPSSLRAAGLDMDTIAYYSFSMPRSALRTYATVLLAFLNHKSILGRPPGFSCSTTYIYLCVAGGRADAIEAAAVTGYEIDNSRFNNLSQRDTSTHSVHIGWHNTIGDGLIEAALTRGRRAVRYQERRRPLGGEQEDSPRSCSVTLALR